MGNLKRFLKYSMIGVSTLLFDLLLLTVFIDVLQLEYYFATPIAYAIAVSINYLISRRYVFVGSARDMKTGYVFFILIAVVGMLFVTAGMYVLINYFSFHYLVSRILVAALAGIWTYLMNFFVNFKLG